MLLQNVECRVVVHNGSDKMYLESRNRELCLAKMKYIQNIEMISIMEWYGKRDIE